VLHKRHTKNAYFWVILSDFWVILSVLGRIITMIRYVIF